MGYDLITKYTSPNHSGRRGLKVSSITIHHWGVRGQRFQNVVNYLCRRGGNSSAHYVAEAGRVACIVDPDNYAWHAGNTYANNSSIGIECRPEASDADYRTVAELIANLRKVYGNVPLKRHSSWKATACPGVWHLSRLDRMADAIARGEKPASRDDDRKPAPKPTRRIPRAKRGTIRSRRLVRRLKKATRVKYGPKWGPGLDRALHSVRMASTYKGNKFPNGVKAAQRAVGTKADGRWGPASAAAHDRTVKAIQYALKKAGYYRGHRDGTWGPKTEAAFVQAWRDHKSY